MAPDFLEQLADLDVPPPPSEFGRQLHQRMNRDLAIVQFIELVTVVFPAAMFEFARALAGLVRFSLSGKYELNEKKRL
ncbi:MAG TPA: hypothetical protein VHY91_15115 [Pirellulales bacterium]|jgi:hypothetical protein|nr:hypothetical protein [Pirellulales bacterium]